MRFRSSALKSLLYLLFPLSTTAQEKPTLNQTVKNELVDSLCHALTNYYVYPDKAILMCQALHAKQEKNDFGQIKDHQQMAARLTKELRLIQNDNHLSVRYDPDLAKRIQTFKATLQKDPSDLVKERAQNFFFRKAEILNGNIGYLLLTNFADTSALSRKTVRAAFQFLANTDALIIDLRNNFGGRNEMAREIAGYFFREPQLTGRTFNRIMDQWTEDRVGEKKDATHDLHLNMPVYILTSERTFSAAEGLAYQLKYLRNAIVVGDTTRGGAHTTRSFSLGNGFVGFIPFTRSENLVTKTDWEGTGVIPNIAIAEELALAKSQELILQQKLKQVSDTIEKLKLQWLLNDLRSKMPGISVPLSTLQRYTGAFEEFLFTLEGGQLYCRNTHQKDKKDRLTAINDHLFRIDEQSQVEFLEDKDGVVRHIRILWNDGWIDTIAKAQK